MIKNIIKSINLFDSKINVENIEFSNNIVNTGDLISLYNLRLNIYIEKDSSSEDKHFLNKKIQVFKYLEKLNISNIKMVSVDKYIFYFDENYDKIYLVIDKMKNEVKCLV